MRDGYGIDELVDPVTEHVHSLGESQSALENMWFVSRLHGLYGHVGCAWDHNMISILWQELVRGGGMGRPPDQALYRDNVLPFEYWEHESPRIGTIGISPLAVVELGFLGLPWQMRRCILVRGGCTSSVVDEWEHMVLPMVHGGIALSVGVLWGMDFFHRVKCYAEQWMGMYLCVVEHDGAQEVVKVLSLERSPDEGIKHTIGFGTLIFGEQVDHRAESELPFITL